MKGKSLWLVLIVGVFLWIALGTAWAEPVPEPPSVNSYVFDYAGLLDPEDVNKMRSIAEYVDEQTRAEIVVVTVNDLDGLALEDYSLRLFRDWGLGDKEKNNGILLLVNKENLLANRSGRIRIEVGYGLEGAINDGKAGAILDNFALPAFEQKQYSKGIHDAFMAILSEVAKEYDLDLSAGELSELKSYAVDDEVSSDLMIALLIFLIIVIFILPRGRRRYPQRSFRGPFFGGPFGGGGFGGRSFRSGGFGSGSFRGRGFGGGSGGGGGASR